MEPVFGFLLFFVACLIVSIIASKRGRSGILVFIISAALGFGIVVLCGMGGASSLAAGFAAFIGPAVGFLWSLSSKNSEALAIEKGEHGEFKKCPFCAESIRKEAIKCKHCGSDLKTES